MFSEQTLLDLPEDNELAFVRLESMASDRLEQQSGSIRGYGGSSSEYEKNYMSAVLAAANAFRIEELQQWSMPSAGDEDALTIYRNFRQEARRIALELHIRAARRIRKYSVAFDAATKAKLHHHIMQIRDTISKLEVAPGKKERLFGRVADLELEIDKDRTNVEAFGALAIEAATDANKASRPILEVIERIGAFFGYAKANEEEQARLPAPKKPKQLEAPKKKKLSSRADFEKDLDEEIPF